MPIFTRVRGLAILVLGIGLFLWISSVQAQTPRKQWEKVIGGAGHDQLFSVQLTNDGGYVAAGSSTSNKTGDKTQANQGIVDYWIVKFDASGSKQWDRTFGGRYAHQLQAVQQTRDGGYILGGYSNSDISGDKTQTNPGAYNYWVVKLDAAGNKLWDRTYGGSSVDYFTALQQTSDGGYILGGFSSSGISGSKSEARRGDWDYWVVKIDANGDKQWDRTLGGGAEDNLQALQQTTDGGYLLGGYSYSNRSGDKTQNSQGGSDYWLVKLDANGNKLWDRTLGGTQSDELHALQATRDGGFMAGGWSYSGVGGDKSQPNHGDLDYWVVQLNADGTKRWERSFGGNKDDMLFGLQPTSDGGTIVGGRSYSDQGGDKTQPNQGDADYWVVKLDPNGKKEWDSTAGGSKFDDLRAIQQMTDGSYLLGGFSDSGISGNKTQAGRGFSDFWFVKLGETVTAANQPAGHEHVQVYPNPAHTSLTIQVPSRMLHAGLLLSLLDATGRPVLTKPLAATETAVTVEVGQYPAGLYLLRVAEPNGRTTTHRVILQ